MVGSAAGSRAGKPNFQMMESTLSGTTPAASAPEAVDVEEGGGPRKPNTVRLVAVALLSCAVALLAYGLVDWTGTFAVKQIEVTGVEPDVARAVERALVPLEGKSLVSLGGPQIQSLSRQVPAVLAVKVDRDFPNTLRVRIVPHRPVAVVRSGSSAWVVSRQGSVLEAIKPNDSPHLPRVWLPVGSRYEPGETLRSSTALAAARALAHLPQPFPMRVISARGSVDDLTLTVGSAHRVELRLGEVESLRLKLAVAAQVLRALSPAEVQTLTYLDVSVPERPVAA